jgi:hypothetical protein
MAITENGRWRSPKWILQLTSPQVGSRGEQDSTCPKNEERPSMDPASDTTDGASSSPRPTTASEAAALERKASYQRDIEQRTIAAAVDAYLATEERRMTDDWKRVGGCPSPSPRPSQLPRGLRRPPNCAGSSCGERQVSIRQTTGVHARRQAHLARIAASGRLPSINESVLP